MSDKFSFMAKPFSTPLNDYGNQVRLQNCKLKLGIEICIWDVRYFCCTPRVQVLNWSGLLTNAK